MFKQLTTAFSYFIFTTYLISQSYSVTNILHITPPYSSYIPDYLDPTNFQFSNIITLNDYYEPERQVKLKISFIGDNYSIFTSPNSGPPPITLTPGIPISLSGTELTPYLSVNNLIFNGLSRNQYEETKSLPEGPCQICIQVIDYDNPNQIIIGNLACQTVWFSKFDPPIMNQPFCGSTVEYSEIQFINFNWSPLHYDLDPSRPTEYKFQIFEIRPTGIDPNIIVNSTLPFFETTTAQTYYNYTLSEPPLQEGAYYAWRIQAFTPDGRSSFKNNGFSEVCSFRFGSPEQNALNQVQISLNSQGVSARRGSAWWNFDSNVDSYNVQYRKVNGQNWFSSQTNSNSISLKNLEPEKNYQVRVRAKIGLLFSEWSNSSYFQTDPNPNYDCNSEIFPPIPPDFTPLNQLYKYDIVQLGQFELKIKESENLGNGHFNGLGTIFVPFILQDIRVNFDNLLIDDRMVVRQGDALAISQGLESWIEENEINNSPTSDIDGTITHIETQDSIIIIYLENGDTIHFDFDNDPMVFEDYDGNQYAVFSDGRIIKSSAITVSIDTLQARDDFKITFEAFEFQYYGFDKFEYGDQEKYEIIRLSDQSLYHVPYKSIQLGTSDFVIASLICDTCSTNNVTFKTLDGQTFEFQDQGDGKLKLELNHLSEHKFIYAFYRDVEIGKLAVKVYEEQIKNLNIVNLTGQSINESDIQDELNETFNQALIQWNVEFLNFDPNTLLGSDNLIQSSETDLLHKYSEEMRTIRNSFFSSLQNIDKNQFYLFVVPGFSDPSMDGYMVRGKSVGFIKINSPPRAFVHEIGHGLGGLQHTFPEIPEGTSPNLMDYSTGNHLTYSQWKKLRTPFIFNWFDDEEDAALKQVFLGDDIDIPIIPLRHELTDNCNTFKSKNGIFLKFSESQEDQIIQYHLQNELLKVVIAPHPKTNTPSRYCQVLSGQIQNNQLIQESINNYFVCFECLECQLVEHFGPNDGVCQKKAIQRNGSEAYAYKYIPAQFRIDISKENQINCANNIQFIAEFSDANPICRASTPIDCNTPDEGEGAPTNPNSLVIATEILPSFESADKKYCWVNIYGKPVKTHLYNNISCNSHLLNFEFQNKEYIAILKGGVYTLEGASYYEYVIKEKFDSLYQLKQNQGDSLRIKDLPADIFFAREYFTEAQVNEAVHYRMYQELGCFMEYEFQHDGRETYTLTATRFQQVQHEAHYGSNCSWELFSHLFCNELSAFGKTTAELIQNLLESTTIPRHIFDKDDEFYSEKIRDILMFDQAGFMDEESKSLQFAFLCGLYNGVVNEIGESSSIGQLMTALMCDPDTRTALMDLLTSPEKLLDQIIFDPSKYDNPYKIEEARGRYIISTLLILVPLSKTNWIQQAQNLSSSIINLPQRTKQFIVDIKDDVTNKLNFKGQTTKELYYTGENHIDIKLGKINQDGDFVIHANRWSENIPNNYQLHQSFDNLNFKKNQSSNPETADLAVYKDGDGDVLVGRKVVKVETSIDEFVTDININQNLPNWIQESFFNGQYRTVQTNSSVTLYRDFGGDAMSNGSFCTTIDNATRDQLALHTSFNNTMRFKATIEVPVGRELNIGQVGPYPPNSANPLPGGADQILLEMDYPKSWITSIFDSQTGIYYSIQEFEEIFPQLVRN